MIKVLITFAVSFLTITRVFAAPNILFIVSEDNNDHLGCYGEKRVHTPAIDSLAKEGVRYTSAYVPYSVCSPSRAAFLTGLYPRQTGQIGLATHKFSMYGNVKTMPAYFKENGYYTGFLGKIHINPEWLVEKFIDHRAIKNNNFDKKTSIEEYANQAKKVMVNASAKEQPFFLVVNFSDAHRKFIATSKHGYPKQKAAHVKKSFPWLGCDNPHLRKEITNYFNCINRLDEGVGMVLNCLDELKLRDNTVIVYISDHGADLPRAKGTVYEAGVRVPMILSYPKLLSSAKVEDSLVSTLDILPTLLSMSDIAVPGTLPGINLMMLDEGAVTGHQYIHTFTSGSSPASHYIQFAIRDERYKLVYNPYREKNLKAESKYKAAKVHPDQQLKSFLYPDEFELYDLDNDPSEMKDIINDKGSTKIKSRLLSAMKEFQVKIDDPFREKKNLDFFHAEQVRHRNLDYRKTKEFSWSHRKLFVK